MYSADFINRAKTSATKRVEKNCLTSTLPSHLRTVSQHSIKSFDLDRTRRQKNRSAVHYILGKPFHRFDDFRAEKEILGFLKQKRRKRRKRNAVLEI
jgi:hypothetical protein